MDVKKNTTYMIKHKHPMPRRSARKSPSFRGIVYPTATTIKGQRRQVWEGRADMTRGGLVRSDLKMNANGSIVSKRASSAGKKRYVANGLSAYTIPKNGDMTWLSQL